MFPIQGPPLAFASIIKRITFSFHLSPLISFLSLMPPSNFSLPSLHAYVPMRLSHNHGGSNLQGRGGQLRERERERGQEGREETEKIKRDRGEKLECINGKKKKIV